MSFQRSSYREVFPRRNTFLAVVHVEDPDQVLRNVRIAFDKGADGVFLINHQISAVMLYACYCKVRQHFPDQWIGMNWLDLSPIEALEIMTPTMNGMWIDNAGIHERVGEMAQAIAFAVKRHEWEEKWKRSFLLFGGVAFKYQAPVKDVAKVARLAMPYVDVITTSGKGTGMAADVDKIRTMKQAIGDHPLAIASGITPENFPTYRKYVDCVLVATGISFSHTELNPAGVRALSDIVSE